MALLFCDGFDHYDATQIEQKWDSAFAQGGQPIAISSPGRNTSATYNQYLSLLYGTSVAKNIPNSGTLTIGFAFNPSDLQNQTICAFNDQTQTQLTLALTSAGELQIVNGSGSVLGITSSSIIATGGYTYVELQVVFSTTSGSIAVNINGSSVLTASDVITAVSANSYANILSLNGAGTGEFRYDDFYVCDSNGTYNNGFLGNTCILLAVPDGNGLSSNWTRNGGSSSGNYTAVDEIPPDGDTSYVSTSVVGPVDSYSLTSIGTVSAIYAVQLVASARKDASGSRSLGLGFSNSTNIAFDNGYFLTSNYEMSTVPLDENPITAAAWGSGDMLNAQVALKVLA